MSPTLTSAIPSSGAAWDITVSMGRLLYGLITGWIVGLGQGSG